MILRVTRAKPSFPVAGTIQNEQILIVEEAD